MSQSAGQAAKMAAGGVGRLVHRLLQLVLALVVLLAVGIGALSVRLAQGPLEIAWLARRVVEMANAGDGPMKVSVRAAALTWQGLRGGVDASLELVLSDVRIDEQGGDQPGRPLLLLPRAVVSVAPSALLRGQLALRNAELDGLRLRLLRSTSGALSLDFANTAEATDADAAPDAPAEGNPAAAILAALAVPPTATPADGATATWSQIRRLRIHDASVTVVDRQLGLVWRAPGSEIDLTRAAGGGANGQANLTLQAGGEQITLDTRLALLPAGGGLTLTGSMSPVTPAHLATLTPALAPLSALDAPVTLSGTLTLSAELGLRHATLAASVGAGAIHAGTGIVPIRAMSVSADATATTLNLQVSKLLLQPRLDAEPSTVTASVAASLNAGQIAARVAVDIDQVAFADLPVLWPAGVGGPGTRPWVTENITAGQARNAHVELELAAPKDFSDAKVTAISGGLDATEVTTYWLRPVPPIEHGNVKLVFVDPDTIDILINAGRQSGTGLAIRSGKVRVTGIAGHNQFIAIQSDIAGPFADVVTLLHHPKIQILDRRPIPMTNPTGQITTSLTVNLPLKNDLDMDSVAIHAVGKLIDGHIGGVAAGRDVDHANLDVDINNEGLKLKGPATIAGLPSVLDAAMDFRNGAPSQVLTRVNLTATVDPPQLARLGLDTKGVLGGSVALNVALSQRRDGAGTVTAKADLSHAALDVGRAKWRKTDGTAGTAEMVLRLNKDQPVAIERVQAEAPGLSVLANADMVGGRPTVLHIQRLVVGDGTNLTGEVRMPARDGLPYGITVSGPSLDLSGELDRKSAPTPAAKPDAPEQRGTPFTIDAKLNRVVVKRSRQITGVAAHLDYDGLVTTTGHIDARAGDGAFAMDLTPAAGGRRLTGHADDAGSLLRALDVMEDMRGGKLTLNGEYNDTKPGRPLSGTADITDFRIQNAPVIARLLQAMSLYGLVQAVQGPGLGFDRLVAPFTLQNDVLTLGGARTFNASLGMTAKGSVDLGRDTAAIEGTIVPIYFFNTLLGRVPLLGKLFSPEAGGGLFAATYSVRGPLADPSISVNPLAALTPGLLRGLFDIFDEPPGGTKQPPSVPLLDQIQR